MKSRALHLPVWTQRALLASCLLVLFPRDGYAYIDPGTGSLAWQVILSTVLGGTFYARRTIGNVWRSLGRRLRGAPQPTAASTTDTDVGD